MVFSLALSWTRSAVVAAAGPMVTLPVVLAVSPLPASSPPAVPPGLPPVSAGTPPASPSAGEGAEAPPVRRELAVPDGGGAAGPGPPGRLAGEAGDPPLGFLAEVPPSAAPRVSLPAPGVPSFTPHRGVARTRSGEPW